MHRTWRLVFTSAALFLGASQALAGADCKEFRWDGIAALAEELTSVPYSKDLVRCEPVPLKILSGDVWRVSFIARVPAIEVVLVAQGEGAKLLIQDKQLVHGWEDLVSPVVGRTDIGAAVASDPMAVAADLTRVFVDSNPSFGILLADRGDIPVTYASSDRLRDVQRRARSPEQVASILLESAPEDISPPAVASEKMVFFTWHYFGGEVIRWTFSASCRPHLRRDVLAREVGSFGYYM